jgi:tetratricopeptide (TPR) repeat protein
LRHLARLDLSSSVGKKRQSRKEDHGTKGAPASADSKPDSCSSSRKTGFALDGKKLVAGAACPEPACGELVEPVERAEPGLASARPATTQALFFLNPSDALPGVVGDERWRALSPTRPERFAGLLLFLLVVGVFLPALRHDFLNYDDPGFVTENVHVQGGFTWANVKWAFLSADIDYWRPLSWLSHMADCQVFGFHPWGHHLTNILLHALNSLLVFAVLRQMTGAVWRSLLVAALFGLHPLHVETVAWIAERKDVLGTLFWLLTIWAYARWVRQRAAQQPKAFVFYGLALAFFVLGLMCKPMLVTVPCVLLLLDFWPLNRFGGVPRLPPPRNNAGIAAGLGEAGPTFAEASAGRPGSARSTGSTGSPQAGSGQATPATNLLPSPAKPRFASLAGVVWSLVVEKIPFFALAAAVAVLTFVAQKQVGALKTAVGYPWPDRIANALVAYCRYLGKCGFPAKLAVFYPYTMDQPVGRTVLAGVLLTGVTVTVCALYRQRSYLLVGWLWFLGTLVPVIGLVQVGEQSMADRYSYMPLVGVFIMLVWTAGDLTARWGHRSELLGMTAGAIVAACIVLTSRQLVFWQDSATLFRHALAVTEDNWAAHTYLGVALSKSPAHLSEAIAEYEAGLRIAPNVSEAHNYLANALAKTPGREPEAIAEFQTALRLNPKIADAHSNLATILVKIPGRLPEAIAEYQAALRLKPESAEIHYYLGLALARMPRLPEAITEFQTALGLQPESAEMHYNLGLVLAETPALPEAIAEYRTALQIRPGYADAHYGLGLVLAKAPDRLPEAIAEFRAALLVQPDDPKIHNALGNAWLETPGRLPDAIAEFQTALRLQPDFVEVHNNLGMALAQLPGRLPEAIAEYEAVLHVRPDFAEAHYNLGNALAGTPGRGSEAIAEYEAAIRINSNYVEAHFSLGLLLATLPGQLSRAIAEYEAALRARPDFAEAHYNLGIALAGIPGRLPEAIAEYEAALRARPDFAEAHNNLADALVQTPGRASEAIAEYEAAIRFKPDFFQAHFNLGLLLSGLPGRRSEAIGHFASALQIKPDFDPARTMIERLRAAQQ